MMAGRWKADEVYPGGVRGRQAGKVAAGRRRAGGARQGRDLPSFLCERHIIRGG